PTHATLLTLSRTLSTHRATLATQASELDILWSQLAQTLVETRALRRDAAAAESLLALRVDARGTDFDWRRRRVEVEEEEEEEVGGGPRERVAALLDLFQPPASPSSSSSSVTAAGGDPTPLRRRTHRGTRAGAKVRERQARAAAEGSAEGDRGGNGREQSYPASPLQGSSSWSDHHVRSPHPFDAPRDVDIDEDERSDLPCRAPHDLLTPAADLGAFPATVAVAVEEVEEAGVEFSGVADVEFAGAEAETPLRALETGAIGGWAEPRFEGSQIRPLNGGINLPSVGAPAVQPSLETPAPIVNRIIEKCERYVRVIGLDTPPTPPSRRYLPPATLTAEWDAIVRAAAASPLATQALLRVRTACCNVLDPCIPPTPELASLVAAFAR
ncbi:hypothetical protein BDK51DRAFT_52008, partial [Blyttiomyces helicus]